MIYIIEGITGAGKTTFANSLKGFEVRKTNLNTLEEIKETLSKIKGDVVFDRMFGIKRVDRQYEGFIRLFSLMDVFVEKE